MYYEVEDVEFLRKVIKPICIIALSIDLFYLSERA